MSVQSASGLLLLNRIKEKNSLMQRQAATNETNMLKSISISSFLLIYLLLSTAFSFGQKISEPFEFQFEGKTLKGLIEKPQDQESKAIILIIPGYGRTDFVEGSWYSNLRGELVSLGLTVCFWDKMGCGGSEGIFDAQQPVENSADEAILAIQKIKEMKITGSEKIGLWGLSRAGWICPLINEKFPVDFWISVSGTNDKENFGYLLRTNLIIAGKSEKEADELYQAWKQGHKVFATGGTYEENMRATQALHEDSTSRRLFGYSEKTELTEEGRAEYLQEQKTFTSKGHFDEESGLWVYVEDFDKTLLKFKCPVLAIFGDGDSQVDWRETKKLYEETIGTNPNAELTVKVFEKCNHVLQKCITCGYREDLSALGWEACDNYYETMGKWLRDNGIVK